MSGFLDPVLHYNSLRARTLSRIRTQNIVCSVLQGVYVRERGLSLQRPLTDQCVFTSLGGTFGASALCMISAPPGIGDTSPQLGKVSHILAAWQNAADEWISN